MMNVGFKPAYTAGLKFGQLDEESLMRRLNGRAGLPEDTSFYDYNQVQAKNGQIALNRRAGLPDDATFLQYNEAMLKNMVN